MKTGAFLDIDKLERLIHRESPESKQVERMLRSLEITRRLKQFAQIKNETLRIYHASDDIQEFHRSRAKWRLLIGSNRSKKTTSAAAELCRCLLGMDPHDKFIPRNGKAMVVGLKEEELATMWRKIGEPGAIKLIPDEYTGIMRAVRPDPENPLQLDPYDDAYREKWIDAPPFLPKRKIYVAWEDFGKGVPKVVRVHATGWAAFWHTSRSQPPQGEHYQAGWFDEHIQNADFYTELCRGLVALAEPPRHYPRAWWSATAQNDNPQLWELFEQAKRGEPMVEAWILLIDRNPYIPAAEKQTFFNSLSPEDREVRYYGQSALSGRSMYPMFSPMGMHGFDPEELPPRFEERWARYVVLDPGHQHLGTIFAAVDPDEQHVWIYRACLLRNGDSQQWAALVAEEERGVPFEAIIIDARAGQQHQLNGDHTTAEHYWSALRQAGIRPRQIGTCAGFIAGSQDVMARGQALRCALLPRGEGPFQGSPLFRFQRGAMPELESQIRYAQTEGGKPKKRKKMPEDLLVCAEYLAAYQPHYAAPSQDQPESNVIYDHYLALKKRSHRLRA